MADAPAQDGDGGQDLGGHMPGSPNAAPRKPRKLRKPNDVARCQVDGCGHELTDAKLYLRRYSVCEQHFKAECVTLNNGRFRFCQQCNKFQELDQFTGTRRSCKSRSEDRNLRRRKQRTDDRNAGVEAELPPDAAAMGAYATAAGMNMAMATGMPNGAGGGGRGSRGAGGGGGIEDGSQQRPMMVDNGGGLLRQLAGDDATSTAPSLMMGGPGMQQQHQQQQQQLQQQQQHVQHVQQLLLAAAAGQQGVQGGHQMDIMGNNAFAANNALQLLAGGGRNGMHLAGPGGVAPAGDDGGASANMLQQLQLAQIIKQAAGGNAMALNGLGAQQMGAANAVQLLQAQQLLQAAAAQQQQQQQGGGGNGGFGGSMGDLSGLQDLSQMLLQQQLQQQGSGQVAGGGAPVLLLHNQNVMVVSLDQLGLLTGNNNSATGGGMSGSMSGGMGGVAAANASHAGGQGSGGMGGVIAGAGGGGGGGVSAGSGGQPQTSNGNASSGVAKPV